MYGFKFTNKVNGRVIKSDGLYDMVTCLLTDDMVEKFYNECNESFEIPMVGKIKVGTLIRSLAGKDPQFTKAWQKCYDEYTELSCESIDEGITYCDEMDFGDWHVEPIEL